ncbi:MAG: tetratricopeptide repeat protein, partial [Bacteroidota bacterium]
PTLPEVYNNLANLLISLNRDSEAIEYLQQALALRRHFGKALFNMGRIYLKQKNVDTAIEFFKKSCMAGDFDNEFGFNFYGLTCLMAGRYDESINAYKKTLSLNPKNNEALINLGYNFLNKKDYKMAAFYFERGLSIYPDDITILKNLVEVYFITKKYTDALQTYNRLREHDKPITINPEIAARLNEMRKMNNIELLP